MLIILNRPLCWYEEQPHSKREVKKENKRVKKAVTEALKKPLPEYKVLNRRSN